MKMCRPNGTSKAGEAATPPVFERSTKDSPKEEKIPYLLATAKKLSVLKNW